MASSSSRSAPLETLYFAYGSNLHLAQMALRCPSARYIGPAHLHGFRFQINQRGYANVMPSSSPKDFVAGLCYLLSKDDEQRLDVNEGVAAGAYEKEILEIELFLLNPALVGHLVSGIVKDGLVVEDELGDGREGRVAHARSGMSSDQRRVYQQAIAELRVQAQPLVSSQGVPVASERAPVPGQQMVEGVPGEKVTGGTVRALVYVSRRYTAEGEPWGEYVDRMNLGIADAVKLGISEGYVEDYVRKYIPLR